MLKSTYGTGCFALLNTGETLVESQNRLLGTIAYQFDGKPTYALEGSIFIAGAVVQWLRDGLQMIKTAAQSQGLAETADPDAGGSTSCPPSPASARPIGTPIAAARSSV
jgi:glycerol kinase